MARPSNTAERRGQIVDGLLKVMATTGYGKASVQAIAKAAGLSPGLVHYHFDNKQEILVALIERLEAVFEERLDDMVGPRGDDPQRRLDCWIAAALARGEGAAPEVVQAWVFIGAEALRQPEVQQAYEAAVSRRIDFLEELLCDTLRASGRQTRNANRLAALMLSTVEGAYQLGTAAGGALPDGFAAETLHRAVDALLAAELKQRS